MSSPQQSSSRRRTFVGMHRIVSIVVPPALAIAVGSPLSAAQTATTPVPEDCDGPISIGVLYREGAEGTRVLDGTRTAFADYESRVEPGRFCLRRILYADEASGFEVLRHVLATGEVQIVLGPTDSGVFLDADRQREEIESYEIPVISPLVTTEVPNHRDGWLFRTNVDVGRRTDRIYDLLRQRGYQSLAVVYTDTAFGRRAEEAFREQLSERQSESYLAIPFSSARDLRAGLRRVLEDRPGAVGMFALRHEIRDINRELRLMNASWSPFNPLLFTIIDARALAIDDLYFVSVAPQETPALAEHRQAADPEPRSTTVGEVEGLAYDTASFVLDVASDVAQREDTVAWRRAFRRRFAALLAGPTQHEGTRTGMRFAAFENRAEPKVYTLSDGRTTAVPLGEPPSLGKRLQLWVQIRSRRFGYLPWVNLTLLLGVVAMVSLMDVRQWYEGRSRSFVVRPAFLLFLFFNLFTACALYVFLAETGRVLWSSSLGALTVAFAHTAILKTTVFQTPAGRAIGLSELYDGVVKFIQGRLMMAHYRSENAKIKFVAFTNTLQHLRSALEEIYRYAKTPERRQELLRRLDARIADESSILEQRKICAGELLRVMSWQQLVEQRLAPSDIPERQLIDPSTILKISADYCFERNAPPFAELESRVRGELAKLKQENKTAHAEAKQDLENTLRHAKTQRGRYDCYLNWLSIQHGFRIASLKREKLLPDNFEEQLEQLRPGGWQRLGRWFGQTLSWRTRGPGRTDQSAAPHDSEAERDGARAY